MLSVLTGDVLFVAGMTARLKHFGFGMVVQYIGSDMAVRPKAPGSDMVTIKI